jgi:hypothetical protein
VGLYLQTKCIYKTSGYLHDGMGRHRKGHKGPARDVKPEREVIYMGRSRFDPRQRRRDFSSSLCVQTDAAAQPASCTMGTGGPFPGGKARSGRDADHSPPSSAKVENE